APPGLRLKAYRVLTRLATPAAGLILSYRRRQGKEDPVRIKERLGITKLERPAGKLAWVHAASVGEANAILPLIEKLRDRQNGLTFLLTTGTRTSAAMAARRLSPQDIHQFAPLDAPRFVARFLDHWRPDLAVLTESEIWPNTILECHDRRIPMALINARMSDRSFRRWRGNRSLSRPLFSRLCVVLAQNEKLARRFRQLGARDSRPVGNLKIDAPPLPYDTDACKRLSAAIGDRPVWLAASTHPGEEDAAIAAHRTVTRQLPRLLTIIAPRHPERGGEIEAMVKAAGLHGVRRSTGAVPNSETDIYIADTIGELGMLYALTPAAFIGGSLTLRGGQNPIEAIRFGAAVITGPDYRNFTDAYAALTRLEGAVVVKDAGGLAAQVLRLLADEPERARMQASAQQALESLGGALRRTTDILADLLAAPNRNSKREP
ncbi:MAG TPA: 3-deoxy-D-manno-octulosonic acid transferase, partial [Hyphomicrobiaceae bacterium]|nr:3-deoxy-D-manno-octulosonic acid transferase [Hyphomicrobiaceae bacterium]